MKWSLFAGWHCWLQWELFNSSSWSCWFKSNNSGCDKGYTMMLAAIEVHHWDVISAFLWSLSQHVLGGEYYLHFILEHLLYVSLVADHILVGCMKVDLLPKGTDMAAVGDWVLRATLAKKLKYVISRSLLFWDVKLFDVHYSLWNWFCRSQTIIWSWFIVLGKSLPSSILLLVYTQTRTIFFS